MVCLYAANISHLPDPKEYPEILEGLWEERKEKALQYKHSKGRKQCAGAGLLLKYALEKHDFTCHAVTYGENGKPGMDGICFNLSHSEDWVICAVSKKEVGCDIEKISELKSKVAERFFSSAENEYLNTFEGDAKVAEFFRLWTMKESYLKMTGEGISFALNRIGFEFGEEIKAFRDGILCDCFVKEYELPDYKVAVCAEEEAFADKIEILKL